MTDKEKLEAIRAEIHRLVDVRGYDREMANDLFAFMDSLPNEPVSEVWHNAQTEQPQAKEKILATNEYGDCEVDFAINMALYWPKVIKWAYIEDLLNLSNVERIGENLKEPVSEDLEKVANEWDAKASFTPFYMALDDKGNPNGIRQDYTTHAESFKAGAQWQKEHLWKSADGEDLPEYEREVIVLTQPYPLKDSEYAVYFAHRPNKYAKVWNSDLGEEQVVEIERHDKGGWNIPDVKYWLDVELPKEIEL